MAELFQDQNIIAFPQTLAPAKRFPIIGNRIFGTLKEAQAYVDEIVRGTAVPGIILSVIADGDNNGAYWVLEAAGYDGAEKGVLLKMGWYGTGNPVVGMLDDLTDVSISNPSNGQFLIYDSSLGVWTNKALSIALASSSTRGGIKVGFSPSYQSGSYYNIPVELSSEKAFVKLTKTMVSTALGYTPMDQANFTGDNIVQKLGYTPFDTAEFTEVNIKSKLGISDWALKATKPSYSKSDVGLDKVDNLAAGDYFTELSSDTTNAISATIGGTNKKITAGTLKSSLGLGSLAYLSEIPFTSISDVVVSNPSGGQALVYDSVRRRWVNETLDLGDKVTYDAVIDALEFTPFDSAAFTKANIKNALGIADWALAANKPSYTWTDIGSRPAALSAFTNDLGLGSLAYKSSLVASDIPSLPWSKITSGKPTTLSGYGIADAYTITQIETRFNNTVIYSDYIDITNNDAYRHIGYGYASIGWKTSGPAAVFGTALYNLRMQCAISNTDTPYVYVSHMYNGVAKEWAELVTYEGAAGKGFEALSYKIGETYVLHRSGNDTFLNYGNRTTGDLHLYGKNLRFSIDGGSSYSLRILNDGSLLIHDIALTKGTSNSLKAGGYEALQYFADGKLIMHRNKGATGTYINYGGRTEGLALYGSALSFNIGDTGAALILSANKDASFTANLTVVGNMYSKNYPAGKALLQDPTPAFISTIFDADAVGSSGYRLRIVKALETGFDRIIMPYSPMVVIKSNDTHGFISFGYNEAGRTRCYIGGGNADKINWSGILFHDYMDLIPKDDGVFYLGHSDKRWRTLNAVNVSANGLFGYVPNGGTYQRYRVFYEGDKLYIQAGSQDGLSTVGKLAISGIYSATLADFTIYSQQTSFSGAVKVSGTSQFVSLATFDNGLKIGDATLTWDATAGMLKIDKGVYSEGAITAKKKA